MVPGKPDLPPPWEKAVLTGGPLGPGKPVGPWGPLGPWEQRMASLRTGFFPVSIPHSFLTVALGAP